MGRPGNLDSPAAAVAVSSVIRLLPKLVAKGASLEPGSCVVIEVTGPVAAHQGVRVELDQQGRLRGHAMFGGQVGDTGSGYDPGTGTEGSAEHLESPTTISLSTEAFTRRAAGRRSVRDAAYTLTGDAAIAQRLLEALVATS
mgnify:CR=1 FL=1